MSDKDTGRAERPAIAQVVNQRPTLSYEQIKQQHS